MRKLSRRERNLLIVFIAILTAVIALEFIIFPSMDKIKALESERNRLQLQWSEIESNLGKEELISNQIKKLTSITEELTQQLPSKQDSHLYWEYINISARQSGISLVQIQESQPEGTVNNRTIHLSITGGFSETIKFIETLQKMPYIYAISESTFQKNNELITSTLTLYVSAYQDNTPPKETKKKDEQRDTTVRDPFN